MTPDNQRITTNDQRITTNNQSYLKLYFKGHNNTLRIQVGSGGLITALQVPSFGPEVWEMLWTTKYSINVTIVCKCWYTASRDLNSVKAETGTFPAELFESCCV